ncbi:Protein of unknown function [Escherichia coli D6-113.11]|nr:Protein of unknown function [Escherichia coli D6-113.11]CDU33734.1 Protein of unknown function [Escherichia coli D6-113.11]
MDLSTP